MRYRELGKTGLKVSEISFGCASLGQDYGGRKAPSRKDAIRLLRKAYLLGINFFDVAPTYGNAEEILGEALGGTADAIFCTKVERNVGVFDSVEASTDRLQRDKLDVLLLHNWWFCDSHQLPGSLFGRPAIIKAQESGLVSYIGSSGYEFKDEYDTVREEEVMQIHMNLMSSSSARELSEVPQKVGIIARQPYARGLLCNPPWSIGEQALRFCLSNKHISTVLVGMQTEEELEMNLRWAELGPLPLENP